MTDLTHQRRAVTALAMLLSSELPPCQWIVFGELGLEGYVTLPEYANVTAAIRAWAIHLGTAVHTDGMSRTVYVSAMYDHVPVRVLAKLPREVPPS